MKKSSFKNKIWIYLCIFSLVILIGILLLQVLSSDFYYEYTKKGEIKEIAEAVSKVYKDEDYIEKLNELSFRKDVCIEITDKSTISYSTDSVSRGCLINNSREINEYKTNFMLSNDDSIMYKVINPAFKNKALLYGIKIDDDIYAFISTSLEPVGSTATVLKKCYNMIV